VKGEPVEYRMIGAEAMVDGLGFELIQPVSGPSIYQEFLDARRGRPAHRLHEAFRAGQLADASTGAPTAPRS
jgi:hypothetical protein